MVGLDFGGGGREAEWASVSLIFTLRQYLLNKAFYKLVNIYWVPPGGKDGRKGYFIKNYKVFSHSFFFLIFIYLFMAVLGLRFCARAFSSCGKWGPLFIAVRRPLTVAEHRLQTRRLSSCGSRA